MSLSADALSITGIDQPFRWNVSVPIGTPSVVTYSFQSQKAAYDTEERLNMAAFTEQHKVYVREALKKWADASGIAFVEIQDAGQMRFSMVDMTGLKNSSGNQLSGFAYYPSVDTLASGDKYVPKDTLGGDVFLNANYYAADANSIAPGIRGFSILIHEIGHALGLKHPFEGDPIIESSHDNGSVTVMSYNRSQSTVSLGTADLEATKFIYGNTGYDTSYDTQTGVIKQIATANSEWIFGTELKDKIEAQSGDDTLVGAYLDDELDGGAGTDTAGYAGQAKQFSVSLNKNGVVSVVDRTGVEGTDSLINIEKLDFTGTKDVNLEILNGVVNVTPGDLSAFIEMYIAYFNRAPDAEGLFYWGTRLSLGMTKEKIAESFFVQPESKALYTNPDDTEGFVTAVYNNFLGRSPDADGLAYWTQQLNDGVISQPIFLLAVIGGAKASTGDPKDVEYFTNKANIGAYFSVIKGMSDVGNAKVAMDLYDGSTASVTAAKNAIDGYYASAQNASNGEFLINLVGVLDDPFAIA